jgi:hypothetical protein
MQKSAVSEKDTPRDPPKINVVTEESPETLGPDHRPAEPLVDDEPKQDASAAPKDDDSQGSDDKSKSRKRSRNRPAERRVKALTRKLEAATASADASVAQIDALTREVEQLKTHAPPTVPKPKMKDFQSAELFGEAWAEWKKSQEAPAALPKQPDAAPSAHPKQVEIDDLTDAGVDQFGEEFTEVFKDDTLPLSATMAEYAFESDRGAEVIMWIDDNRRAARKIFRMDAEDTEEALDKILKDLPKHESRAAADPDPDDDPDPDPTDRRVTKASTPPGAPVAGTDAGDTGEIKEGLSMDDYAKRRRAQMLRDRVR